MGRIDSLAGLEALVETLALAGHAPAAIDLNQPGSYLTWNVFTVSVANLVLIAVMVAIFGVALLLPFPRGRGEDTAIPDPDRLAGVLVDNACRYAGAGGQVRIQVRAQGSRVSLTVEDSGPGILAADRPRLFDRFHRVTEYGSGTALGLALGDSIVRSTGGRWQVGDSILGGALMSVYWQHVQPRVVRLPEPGRVRSGNG